MRRVLALTFCALVPVVALAACSDDNESAFPQLSLPDVASTEAVFEDACATDAPVSSGVDTAGATVAMPAPEEVATTGPAATTEPVATSEPVSGDSAPAGSEPGDEAAPTTTFPTVPPTIEPPDELPTELERTLLEEGSGPEAEPGDLLLVHYAGGFSEDGTPFDDSYSRGTPFAITLAPIGEPAGVIDGWNEGLQGARAGDKLRLDIPSDLAYGEAGNQGIPPNTPLTFVIDVVEVIHLDYPAVAPTEAVTTVLAEGDPDGKAAQRYDEVTLNLAIGVPDPAAEDGAPASSAPSSEPTESAAPTEPERPVASEVPVSSEPSEPAAPQALAGTGTIVFNSYEGDPTTGQPATPFTFPLIPGATGIDGLEQALEGARPGDTFQVDLPPDLAFGEAGVAELGIPGDSPVSIYVDVIDVTGPPIIDVPAEAPDELQVTTITEGDGPAAAEGDTVVVNYVGVVTETNTRIDSNWDAQPEPLVLGEGAYVEGFEQGLVGARAGDELQLDIPADLGYGDAGVPDDSVPGDTALSYLVKVAAVVPSTSAGDAPTGVELPLSSVPRETPVATDAEGNEIEATAEIRSTDLVAGTGDEATLGSTAVVNIYAVCATNGAVLQNTWGDDQRQFIQLSQGVVMDGLVDGIVGMQVGGRRLIEVPAELAFGSTGNEVLGVGRNRDLIFIVDLYGVI